MFVIAARTLAEVRRRVGIAQYAFPAGRHIAHLKGSARVHTYAAERGHVCNDGVAALHVGEIASIDRDALLKGGKSLEL